MPSWLAYAEHVLDCIQKIKRIEDRGSIVDDEVLYAATLRHLQTLSEACQRLPEEEKAREPEIPWRNISGFRNILVHNYLGDIDPDTVQSVVRTHLPALEKAIKRLQRRSARSSS